VQPHSVTLGSAIRHQEVADHPALAQALAALCQLASMIGDPQVRARGTLGGSLANADPSADWPAAALALQATICTDRREIEASRFFTGMFATALAPDEIITAVRFARPRQAAYAKQRHQASGYAIVGVFVARLHDDTVRVAVTGAGACVFRWHEAEKRLGDRFSPQALAGLQLPHEGLNSDLHAPARYRAHLAGVLASRATHAITEANEWN